MASNVDVVRKVYECMARGDLAGVVAQYGDDCEIELMGPESIPFAGRYRGGKGMEEVLGKLLGSCEILEFGPDEFHEAEGLITVIGHEHCRSRATGREWRTRLVDTFRVRDGKIREFVCSYDTAAVADAFREAGARPTAAAPLH